MPSNQTFPFTLCTYIGEKMKQGYPITNGTNETHKDLDDGKGIGYECKFSTYQRKFSKHFIYDIHNPEYEDKIPVNLEMAMKEYNRSIIDWCDKRLPVHQQGKKQIWSARDIIRDDFKNKTIATESCFQTKECIMHPKAASWTRTCIYINQWDKMSGMPEQEVFELCRDYGVNETYALYQKMKADRDAKEKRRLDRRKKWEIILDERYKKRKEKKERIEKKRQERRENKRQERRENQNQARNNTKLN